MPAPTTTTRNNSRARGAQADLATLTDLTDKEVKAVTAAVNPLIADSFALYVKTKNFHWHLSGPHFRDYHLLFDEHAAEIIEGIDPLAERVRKIGGTTMTSISHIGRLQTIEDDDELGVDADQMIQRLLSDNQQMAIAQRAAIEVCETNRDSVTANLLQEVLDSTERRKWFLFEISRGSGS